MLHGEPVLHRLVVFVEELPQHAGFERRGMLLVDRLPVGPDLLGWLLHDAGMWRHELHVALGLLHVGAELLGLEQQHEGVLVEQGV